MNDDLFHTSSQDAIMWGLNLLYGEWLIVRNFNIHLSYVVQYQDGMAYNDICCRMLQIYDVKKHNFNCKYMFDL